MLATVAAAHSASTVNIKSTAFLYRAKRNHTLCTLYINRHIHCVFYSNEEKNHFISFILRNLNLFE